MERFVRVGLWSMLVLLAACSRGGDAKIETAHRILQAQVADDIAIELRGSKLNNTAPDFYYVCGTATLDRPNAGDLTLDHAEQRFIVTVNRERQAGAALFDGDMTPAAADKFQDEWRLKCPA